MMALLRKSATGAFASQTLAGHLIRGAIAFALLWAALEYQHEHTGWALLAGALSLVAMRGCPVCWTIGLVETVVQRWQRTRPPAPYGQKDFPAKLTEQDKAPDARES